MAVTIGYSFIPAPLRQSVALASTLLPMTGAIDFKYSIVDSGSGRELQNRPIHNIAGLGEPNGERPFRPSPNPCCSCPARLSGSKLKKLRKTASHVGAELFIVLHGYKMLGYGTGCHEREPCVRCPSGHRLFQCLPDLRRSLGCRVLRCRQHQKGASMEMRRRSRSRALRAEPSVLRHLAVFHAIRGTISNKEASDLEHARV